MYNSRFLRMPTRSPARCSAFDSTESREKFIGMEHFVEQELAENVKYFTFHANVLLPPLLRVFDTEVSSVSS